MSNQSYLKATSLMLLTLGLLSSGCESKKGDSSADTADSVKQDSVVAKALPKPISEPLVTAIYTADPSAHVFDGRIYVYPSHDIESNTAQDDEGGHFDMKDYHILSMDSIGGKVTDHGVALDIKDVPWAGRQMWARRGIQKRKVLFVFSGEEQKRCIPDRGCDQHLTRRSV